MSALLATGLRLSRSVPRLQQWITPLPVSTWRLVSTYAECPERWQSDPCVQMYGQLLAVKDAQEEAFLVAAETLRNQENLPGDLRASASRIRASVLLQKAGKKVERLQMDMDSPWPDSEFNDVLQATDVACKAYAEALAESAEPELCKSVEPHCSTWSEAVSSCRTANLEVQKFRANLRLKHISWHSQQAEDARRLRDAARRSALDCEEARAAEERLKKSGLETTLAQNKQLAVAADSKQTCYAFALTERELLSKAASISQCVFDELSDPRLSNFRSSLQASRLLMLVDLAYAHIFSDDVAGAVGHMLEALQMRIPEKELLDEDAVKKVRQATSKLMELCVYRHSAEVETGAAKWAEDLMDAATKFDTWRGAF